MLLKSIKLNNIRSYENQEIIFPQGSVLLSGDIGSGKSTVLLAAEFAIFGAKKGELPAYTLLRHGKKEGSVELCMMIDNKDIIIKRILKRANDEIRQEAGYIISDGRKKDATPEELRAIILEMLGYPKDLIRKGKDLIYRYTVYTPQEEMKQILHEGKDTRLDTLRKVFNIEKYKRIRENSRIALSMLKEKKKHLEGFVMDIDYKKKDLEEKKMELTLADKNIELLLPRIEEIKRIIYHRKTSLESIEKEINELHSLKKEVSIADTNLANRIEQNNRMNDEIKKLDEQIALLSNETKELDSKNIDAIRKSIMDREKEIEQADSRYRETIKKIKEIEVRIEHCAETMRKIESLDTCPLCEQKVDDGHKHGISSRERSKHDELVAKIREFKDDESNLEKIRMTLKKEIDSLVREQNHFNILRIKSDNCNEKIKSREEKISLKEKIKKEIGHLNSVRIELSVKISQYSEVEQRYKIVRKEIDELLPQERFLELEKKKYDTEKNSLNRYIFILEKEISEKTKAKNKITLISQYVNWLDEFFVALMSNIEKHVMVSIHAEFNELFKKWFDILMEDETINVRVDEEFTPVIEQNGYETYIENLSGGEKTSVALSYRLALNKVVNDIVSGIKTKDIIILDEPTDGFSTEQLDKMRDILEQLNMKQVIIVSHESKIESFVQNVVRIQKQEHVSMVM